MQINLNTKLLKWVMNNALFSSFNVLIAKNLIEITTILQDMLKHVKQNKKLMPKIIPIS